jgi:DNA uptake protein ComE-like DNA-binding protein
MLTKSPTTTPAWFYLALLPGFGWAPLLFAGSRVRQRDWMACAVFYGCLSIIGTVVQPLSALCTVGWLAGMIHLALIRKRYHLQLHLMQPGTAIQSTQEIAVAQEIGIQVDINQASQHELVYRLNLPITQANRILELRKAGVMFTCLEELASYTGIPLAKLTALGSLIRFNYYETAEGFERWMRINLLTAEQISREFTLPSTLSAQLVAERDQHGAFTSLVDLRQRLALPYDQLTHLL